MGEIQVPGGLSGKMYTVMIAGDAPTPDETARAAAMISEREQAFGQEYEGMFGAPLAQDDGTAFGRGWDVGKTSAYGELGTLARDTGDKLNLGWLEQFGSGMEDKAATEQMREAVQMPTPTTRQDVNSIGSGLTYLGELAGQSAPEMAATLGASGIGGILGGPVGFFGAGTAVATPMFTGRNIQRQEDVVGKGNLTADDSLRALYTGVGQAALNSIGDKLLLTGKLMGLSVPTARNLFVRTGQLGAVGAATEVPTEVSQQILERWQAGLPLDNDEAISEYLDAAVGAGVLGGAVGGARAPFSRPDRETEPLPDTEVPSPENVAAPPVGRSSSEVLDMLNVAPRAPIRKRTAALTENTDAFKEELRKYARIPGMSKETKDAIASYLKTLDAPAPLQQVATTPSQEADAVTAENVEDVVQEAVEETTDVESSDGSPTGDSGTRVPGTEQDVDSTATGTDADESAPAVDAPDTVAVGRPGTDAVLPADGAVKPVDTLTTEQQAELDEAQAELAATPEPDVQAEAAVIEEPAAPKRKVNRVPTDAEWRNSMRGQETGAPGQVIPTGIPGVAGAASQTQTSEQIATARDKITELAKLRGRISEAQSTLNSTRKAAAAAKAQGMKPGPYKQSLKMEINRDRAAAEALGRDLGTRQSQLQARTEGVDTQALLEANNDSLREQIAMRFAENASPEVQRVDADMNGMADATRGVRDPNLRALAQRTVEKRLASEDVTTAADKSTILKLLDMTRGQLRKDAKARNAHAYFSKTAVPTMALDDISYDATSDAAEFNKETGDAATDAFMMGKGVKAAKSATKWIEENLSQEAKDHVAGQLNEFSVNTITANIQTRDQMASAGKKTAEAEAAYYDSILEDGVEAANRSDRGVSLAGEADALFGKNLDAPRSKPSFLAGRMSIVNGINQQLHPATVRFLQNGNLRSALASISATNSDPYIRRLARGMVQYVGNTRVYVGERVGRGSVAFEQLYMPEKDSHARGAYYSFREDELAEIQATSPEFAADMQNAIVINGETGLNVHTVLHEMIHAATFNKLSDPKSPVRARLETLRKRAKLFLEGEYGITDVQEFVAEAMSNQEFQQMLAAYNPSVWVQLGRDIANFIRTEFLGRPRKTYDDASMFDEVDFLSRSLFDVSPDVLPNNTPIRASVTPLVARDRLDAVAARVRIPTKNDGKLIMDMAGDFVTHPKIKRFMLDALTPFRNLMEYARPYYPEQVDRLYEALTGHATAIHDMNMRVRQTVNQISQLVGNTQAEWDAFNELRLEASRMQIDPRGNRSDYDGYTLTYRKKKADGTEETIVDRYNTQDDRDIAVRALDDRKKADEAAGKPATILRPRAKYDFDQQKLDDFVRLKKMYDAMGDNGKQAYRQVVGLFEHMHKEFGKGLQAQLERMMPGQKAAQMALYEDLYGKIISDSLITPYQPLQRRGSYWIVYSRFDPRSNTTELFKESFMTRAQRRAAVAEIEADPDGPGEGGVTKYLNAKELYTKGDEQPPAKFILDIKNLLDKTAVATAKKAREVALAKGGSQADADAEYQSVLRAETAKAESTQGDIVKLALDMTPERSILQAYQPREGTLGYLGDREKLTKTDTNDLLLQKGSQLSRQLADMEYGARARKAVSDMDERFNEKIANKSWNEKEQNAAKVYLESMQDYAKSIYVQRNAASRFLTGAGFAMTLGANVSSAVMNLMAVPTIIGPYLSGKYGARDTMRELSKAMKVIAASGRERSVEIIDENGEVQTRRVGVNMVDYSLDNYEMSPDHEYYQLAQEARVRGLFHNSINYDVLDIEGTMGNGLSNKINTASGFMFHHLERYVREGTLIATYNLELKKMKNAKVKRGEGDTLTEVEKRTAAREAAYATEMTNGTIASTTANKFAQGNIGSVLYLFKRYPLAMYNLLGSLVNQSYPDKKKLAMKYGEGTPEYLSGLENRRVARMQLASIVGSVGLWAGASGLPFYATFAAASDMFRDDDEPDTDTLLRTYMGELGFKGLGNYLTGTEMSSRIGLANMFYREPFRADEKPYFWNIIEGAGGPVVSIASSYADRVIPLLNQGEIWRGIEAGLPAALRAPMRTIRFANEGAETMRGDKMVESFGVGELIGQTLGFSPSSYIQQLEQNTALKRIDTSIVEKRSQLLRKLNVAKRERDTLRMREVREEMREFNARNPQFPIDGDTQARSWKTFQTASGKTLGGMIYNDRNRALIEGYDRAWDGSPTIFDDLGLR